ncbi:MAG: NAD(P)-dependent oxidoreductase [Bacteroidales bacterium]|jgi:D-3-phosphoglycerate dehydrogenase
MAARTHKILFIDSTHAVLRESLEEAGFVCDDGTKKNPDEITEMICNYSGVIIRSRINMDRQLIDKASNLKFIGRVGAGMESIDVAYAESKGIKCFNSPEGNRDAVGEHALGMLIALMNNFLRADRQVRNGEWKREENRGVEIKGKTIGIIGYGNMGSAFAKTLKGFEANVIAYDKYKFNYSDEFVKEVSLGEIFESSDILTLHVPLTDETHYMLNESFINKFKKNFWLINTSRGAVVNTNDLVAALKSGKVKGAALDVIEYEKTSFETLSGKELPDAWKYLINSDKVILTPHIAGWTEESKIKLAKVLAEKIIAFMKGI